MKTKLPRTGLRKVRSLNELRIEKAKLQMEVMMAEERIKGDVRQIREAFSLRNIVSTVVNELTSTTSVLSNTISTVRSIFKGKKKKKKEKTEDGGKKTEDAGMDEEA